MRGYDGPALEWGEELFAHSFSQVTLNQGWPYARFGVRLEDLPRFIAAPLDLPAGFGGAARIV
mgnify:CR=1 FL=1